VKRVHPTPSCEEKGKLMLEKTWLAKHIETGFLIVMVFLI